MEISLNSQKTIPLGRPSIPDKKFQKGGYFYEFSPEQEVFEKRSRNSKHFKNPNGTFRAFFVGLTHYQDEKGAWQDVDFTIRENNSAWFQSHPYANLTHENKTYYPKKAGEDGVIMQCGSRQLNFWKNPRVLILNEREEQVFSISPIGESSIALQSEKILYNDFSGITDEFIVNENGVENNIIINSLQGALKTPVKNGKVAFVQFIALNNGYRVFNGNLPAISDFSSESFTIKGDDDQMGFTFSPIVIFDDAINKSRATQLFSMSLEEETPEDIAERKTHVTTGKYKIHFVPGGVELYSIVSLDWLQNKKRRFPVVVDPTLTIIKAFAGSSGATGPPFKANGSCYSSQALYLAADFTGAGLTSGVPIVITRCYWYVATGAAPTLAIQVYLKKTADLSPAGGGWATEITGATQVYNGNFAFTTGASWMGPTITSFCYTPGTAPANLYVINQSYAALNGVVFGYTTGNNVNNTSIGACPTTSNNMPSANIPCFAIDYTVASTAATAGSIGNAQTICTGGTPAALTSTGAGTGAGTITYEWYDGVTLIGGATAATYAPGVLTGSKTYKRRTKDVNACGTYYSAYTSTITITVVADPVAKTVTSTPVTGSTICVGGGSSATFSGGSGGTGTISDIYEYSTNGGGSWAAYTGGTNVNAPTAGTSVQYRTRRTATGTGCDATANNTATISVVADPVAQTVTSTPVTGSTICVGGGSSATFSGGSGGTGTISDIYENSTNGGGSWAAYTGGTNVNAPTAGTSVQYRTRRTATGTGCDATANNTATITVVADPVAQTVTSSPVTGSTICIGGGSNATYSGGSGGTGTVTDIYEYSTDGGGAWSAYTGGTNVNAPTAGTSVQYRTRRTATGTGCDATANNTATITVVADPVAQTVTSSPVTGSTICVGGGSNATYSGGSGGTGTVTDIYEYSTDGGGAWSAYTGGTNVNAPTAGTSVQYRTRRTATGTGCDATANNTASITINAQPTANTVTGTPASGSSLCIGTSASATFSGAAGGAGTVTDEYQYCTDGGGSWASYTGGNPVYSNLSGNNTLQIRTRRTATGLGCANSGYNTATYIVRAPSASSPTAIATNDYAWSGASSGNWDATANNWSRYNGTAFTVPGTAPTSADHVLFRGYSCGTTAAISSAISCNNLTIESGMTLNVSGTSTFTVNGSVSNAGTFAVTSGTPTIAAKKDFTNTGTFTPGTGTVSFVGTVNQTIAGGSFNNVAFDNSTTGSTDINISQPVNINGLGTFTNGVVYFTGTGALIFGSGATCNGGSATSFVNGEVTKSGTDAFTFPLGAVSGTEIWAPVGIASPSISSDITARYYPSSPGNVQTLCDPSSFGVSNIEYWDLNSTNSFPAVTLYWKDASRSGINTSYVSDIVVAHWEDCSGIPKWVYKNPTTGGLGGAVGSVTSETALPSYSPFAFGTKTQFNPLPIELLGFEAKCSDSNIELIWVTASEKNNSVFTLERSIDAEKWREVSKIKGKNFENIKSVYSFIDNTLFTGTVFYRLKQTDFDGSFTYSGIIYTSCFKDVFENINVYPNPVSGQLFCEIISKENIIANISITDVTGRRVIFEKLNIPKGENVIPIDVSGLSSAPYYFKLEALDGNIKDCKQILVK